MQSNSQFCPSVFETLSQASILAPFATEVPTLMMFATCLVVFMGWSKKENWYSSEKFSVKRFAWIMVLFAVGFFARPRQDFDAIRSSHFEVDCRNPDYSLLSLAEIQYFEHVELGFMVLSSIAWLALLAQRSHSSELTRSQQEKHLFDSTRSGCSCTSMIPRLLNHFNVAFLFTNPISLSKLLLFSLRWHINLWSAAVLCIALMQATMDCILVSRSCEEDAKTVKEYAGRESVAEVLVGNAAGCGVICELYSRMNSQSPHQRPASQGTIPICSEKKNV